MTTQLTATYTSPTNASFTHTHALPSLSPQTATTNPKQRVAYLASLREATVKLQEEINRDLTARMEEDKVREGSPGKAGKGVDEKKEEENYGEEVVEED